jgi:Icc-related predicted phosphoesterase
MAKGKKIRIAALADLHYTRSSKDKLRPVFSAAHEQADIIAVCGDLTDRGLPEEAALFADDAAGPRPILAVLGNHDYEGGQIDQICDLLRSRRIQLLDGDGAEIGGVGFAGITGFCGGFTPRTLDSWGEPLVKAFVAEAIDHTNRLRQALSELTTPKKIAILHYSPVRETVIGEDPEIFPFLGTSRLAAPLDEFALEAIFHGHAHNGAFAGHTNTGRPVYNVSLPVLKRTFPNHPPFFLLELAAE